MCPSLSILCLWSARSPGTGSGWNGVTWAPPATGMSRDGGRAGAAGPRSPPRVAPTCRALPCWLLLARSHGRRNRVATTSLPPSGPPLLGPGVPGCGWQAGGARGGSARAPGPGEDQRPAVSGSPEVACLGRPRQACPAHGLALQGSRRCTWPLDGGRAGCWSPRLSTVVSGTGPRSRVQDGGGTGSSGGQEGTEPGPLPKPRLPKMGALTPTHRDALGLWLIVGPGGAQSLERAGVRRVREGPRVLRLSPSGCWAGTGPAGPRGLGRGSRWGCRALGRGQRAP